jgi:mutator protein MutT
MTCVAIGLIVREGKILVCRRRKEGVLGGFWEFPGGKIEEGERAQDCVEREIAEEVGMSVRVIHAFGVIDWNYPNGDVRLKPFLCECLGGVAQALASDEIRWVEPGELRSLCFPPANAQLVDEVIAMLSPKTAR